MTEAELERLASLIADAILRTHDKEPKPSRGTWLPAPGRPETPARSSEPPPWSGAGQSLGDIAPIRTPVEPRHRATVAELTRATRAAAAGRAESRQPSQKSPETPTPGSSRGSAARRRNAISVSVPIGISKRHLHLSPEHIRALFGIDQLTSLRMIKQPGQFAANQVVEVVGPKGRIASVRVVGPSRDETQLEVARSDAAVLGIEPPLAASGKLDQSAGGVTLIGPYGRVELSRGVIVAARHLHLSSSDAERWGLRDGDRLDVACGTGARRSTFFDVLVRAGPAHATELHLDADEANAASVRSGDIAEITARHDSSVTARRLVTERDVLTIAREHGVIPAGALLTPSATDRARSLGLI
ncbi:MAG: phosphate propanoyltransferase [Gemmatimonadaceae bacterium]